MSTFKKIQIAYGWKKAQNEALNDTESGFTSTSLNRSVSEEGFSGNMFMTINAPKGSKAMNVQLFSGYDEEEILFQAGTRFLIEKAENIGGTLYIDVTVVM